MSIYRNIEIEMDEWQPATLLAISRSDAIRLVRGLLDAMGCRA
jgi:hypothetical protein